MPRRRQQIASASSTPQKRAPSPAEAPLSRQSKRIKSASTTPQNSKVTPKKSQFFDHKSETSEPESEIENEESGYEDEDESASAVSSPPETEGDNSEEEDDYHSDEDAPRKRKAGRKTAIRAAASVPVKGQELWRPGVKTGLGPGEQVFIKLPKARPAGKTPYKDDTIHPNTMIFLGELRENNDREWLKVHDADYRQSKLDFDAFVECLTEKIIENDETIPELPPKDLTFRIYRDIRFSPDPTPYKAGKPKSQLPSKSSITNEPLLQTQTYFSAAWSRTGRKGPYAHYYLQIQPKNTFIGGGIWHPEAQPLALLRRAIDRKSQNLKTVLLEPALRKEFFNGAPNDAKKVVKAFVGQNEENMLKTKPKGFTAENPNIDLLRLRNYTIGRKLKDEEVLSAKGFARVVELMGILTPFITYLNSVVMPDLASSADEAEEEEE